MRHCSREGKVWPNTRKILVPRGLWGLGGYPHGSDGAFPPSLLNQTKPWDLGGRAGEEMEIMTQPIRHRLDLGLVG